LFVRGCERATNLYNYNMRKLILITAPIIVIVIAAAYFFSQRDVSPINDIRSTNDTDCDLLENTDEYEYGVDFEYVNPNDRNRLTADCAPIRYLN